MATLCGVGCSCGGRTSAVQPPAGRGNRSPQRHDMRCEIAGTSLAITARMHRILYSIPFAALLIACSSTQTSTKGQLITCTTDPGTGVVLRCQPGGGDGSGSNTCTDVDEDGDGDPH